MRYEVASKFSEIIAKTFPDFKGKEVKVVPTTGPINCKSCWSEGGRSYFKFFDMEKMIASSQIPDQSMFDPQIRGLDKVMLPPHMICVEESHSRAGTHIYLHYNPEGFQGFELPESPEFTREEKIVLVATRSLKSSYAGVSNYRFVEAHRETGISLEAWDSAKQNLINRGFLMTSGALTIKGKNAAGREYLYNLK